jgi:hypothetical protein
MMNAHSAVAAVRHGCADAYTLIRDQGFSVTRTTVFERQTAESMVRPVAPVSFRFGGAGDILSLTKEDHDYGAAEKRFSLERLEAGDALVIGEWERGVVFYGWLMYAQMDLDQSVPMPLSPDAAYSYKLFTVPRARGLRICAGYYHFVAAALAERGYHRLICRIAPGNCSSIRGHIRVGFQPRGTLWKFVAARHAFYFADRPMRSWLQTIIPSGHVSGARLLRKCHL